jgi:hypothetical protein
MTVANTPANLGTELINYTCKKFCDSGPTIKNFLPLYFINIKNLLQCFVSLILCLLLYLSGALPAKKGLLRTNTWAQCYKTVYGRNLRIFVKS